MELYLGPGASRGEPYFADEVAKQIAGEKKLRKGDTVSKKEIVAYLEKNGSSAQWAADVAMVLRNMYGVCPTFDEDKNAGLISDLSRIISEDANGKCGCSASCGCKKNRRPEFSAEDVISAVQRGLVEAFDQAKDEIDEMIIADLSCLPFSVVESIASLGDVLSESDLNQLEECWNRGGESLTEAWLDVASRPHKWRFLDESVQHQLSEVGAGPAYFSSLARMKRRQATGGEDPMVAAKRAQRAAAKMSGEDPLANRQAGHMMKFANHSAGDDAIADLKKDVGNPVPPSFQNAQDRIRTKVKRNALQKATDDSLTRQAAGPANLPADVTPEEPRLGFGARLKSAGRNAVSALRRVAFMPQDRDDLKFGPGASSPGRRQSAAPEIGIGQSPANVQEPADASAQEPARGPGLLHRIVRGAGRIAGNIGKNAGAAMLHSIRNAAPRLTYALAGDEGDRERKFADMMHRHNMRKAERYALKNYGRLPRRYSRGRYMQEPQPEPNYPRQPTRQRKRLPQY